MASVGGGGVRGGGNCMTCIAFRTATDILDTQEHTSVVRSGPLYTSVARSGPLYTSVVRSGPLYTSVVRSWFAYLKRSDLHSLTASRT